MLDVGESLGTRYKVSKVPEENRAGVLFEVIDRGATAVRAQLLGELSLTGDQNIELRKAVSLMPALPTLLRPRDIVLSARSLPVSVFDRPSIEMLRPRLADMAASLGKKPMVNNLFRWMALIAADLSQAHAVGVVHGAISPHLFVVNTRNEAEPCLLTGFGIGAAVRALSPKAEPTTARKDLVDLLAALHDFFLMAGVQPDGSAAGKWTLLRHSAMHGEHPALASGAALAGTLNEIASLPDDSEVVRPQRMATVAPPPRPGARNESISRPTQRPEGGPRPKTVPPPSAPKPRSAPKFSWPIVLGGIFVILGGVGFAGYQIRKVRAEVAAPIVRPPPVLVAPPAPQCEGENLAHPSTAATTHPSSERAIACSVDGQRIIASARVENAMWLGTRSSARGAAWNSLIVAQGAVEAGSVLSIDGAEWASWRNGSGHPIGLARIAAGVASAYEIPLPGWDVVPLRGVFVAQATARDVFLVTNVESEGGAHAVLLDVALAPLNNREPVVAWYLSSGAAETVIPGADPVVLMSQRSDNGWLLSSLTLHLSAVTAARTPREPLMVHGAVLPPNAVEHSEMVSVPGAALRVAPHGILAEKTFLVSTGPVRLSETCTVAHRCPGAGPVSLVTFGPTPAAHAVAPEAWAEDLYADPSGGLHALTLGLSPRGEPMNFHLLYSMSAPGAVAERASIRSVGALGAIAARCGGETWALYSLSEPAPALATVPIACVGGPAEARRGTP